MLAESAASADKAFMRGMGKRLRRAADALGFTDSEVARRLGLSQARYHNYVAETSEPDLDTVLRICRVLAVTPDDLLLHEEVVGAEGQDAVHRARIQSASAALHDEALGYAADMLDALVESQRRMAASVPKRRAQAASRRTASRPKPDG